MKSIVLSEEAERAELERHADVAKQKLFRALDELERRKERVVHRVSEARSGALFLLAATGVVLGVIFVGAQLRARRERGTTFSRFLARVAAFRRAWTHPDRVA